MYVGNTKKNEPYKYEIGGKKYINELVSTVN